MKQNTPINQSEEAINQATTDAVSILGDVLTTILGKLSSICDNCRKSYQIENSETCPGCVVTRVYMIFYQKFKEDLGAKSTH